MLTRENLLKAITEANGKINTYENDIKSLQYDAHEMTKKAKHDGEKLLEVIKSDAYTKIKETEKLLTSKQNAEVIRKKVLRHNFEVMRRAEIYPIIKEILTKYNGKRIGEKTAKKINAEIEEKAGYCVHVSLTDKITVYYCDVASGYGNETIYNSMRWNDGKFELLEIPEEDLTNYIEDIDGYIAEKQKGLAAINGKIEELKNLIDDYNKTNVGEFSYISLYNLKGSGYTL